VSQLPPELLAALRHPDVQLECERDVMKALRRFIFTPDAVLPFDQFNWMQAQSNTPGSNTPGSNT
jgi:hypothetical protein